MLNKHDVAVIDPAQSRSSVKCMCMGCVEVRLILFCAALRCGVLTHALQHCFAASLYAVNAQINSITAQPHICHSKAVNMTACRQHEQKALPNSML